MSELEMTWGKATQIYWSMMWRTLLYVMLPAGMVGFVVGFFLAIKQIPAEPHIWKLQLAILPFAVFMGIWIIKKVLSDPIFGYRIVLVARDKSGAAG